MSLNFAEERTPKRRRLYWFSFKISAIVAFFGHDTLFAQNFSVPPVQTCTVANIRGTPIAGVACGGSSHGGNCTAGALYNCQSGPTGATNNCRLQQACAHGCLAN